jgi:glycosyltransferase involved in cell wall biosynthesis
VISVLILTYNEQPNIERCLRSVSWSSDIVVLDSGSHDATCEIARNAGARILIRPFDNFAGQRNFGVEHGSLRNEWVLHLDADEEITSELREELIVAAQAHGKDAYRVASQLIFQGKWLKYSAMYPTYQVRFGRKQSLRFQEIGHGQRETLPAEKLGTLKNAIVHHNFSKGLSDWFDRHNRYSSAEAMTILSGPFRKPIAGMSLGDPVERRRAMKSMSQVLPFRPLLRFLYMYVLRRGFLDGSAGFTYCCLLAIYEYMIVVKLKELRLMSYPPSSDPPPIEQADSRP